ncbi:MAG: DUF488 domain-containing protein [Betaproteobacteria bacterium]|jgi:uncharacterized protein (DUF488 family)|nr:DUF488 domain-containing protein [Betaproteobacteria bacterium]
MATVYSIGHGSRDLGSFVALLKAARIERLIDVRAVPRSRRHPQFGYGPLGAHLAAEGMVYDWQGRALGGLRRAGDANRHGGLAEPAFRAYAEHMESADFAAAAGALAQAAQAARVCMMCAERDPAQCHRALIADWLLAHGHRVVHLLDGAVLREHLLHPSVRLESGRLHYADRSVQGELF